MKVRTRWVVIPWAVALMPLTDAQASGPLDAALKSAMTKDVPAIGGALIKQGKVADEEVVGVREIDRADLVKLKDPWHIGSDGKAMTATLIARLVDKGILSWTMPLSEMLPELAETMRPEYRSVTLVDLLSHRSGLPANLDDAEVKTYYHDTRALPVQRASYIASALKVAPIAKPGTKWSYSNTGYIVAAVIAEEKSGVPYEKLMERELFKPLHMGSVGFGTTHVGQPLGHHDGKVATTADANPLMFAPAGNMYMSLDDWSKFCIDQLEGARGGGRILSSVGYHRLQTAVGDPQDSYGLGWGVLPDFAHRQGPVLSHNGSDGNWFAFVALFPKTNDGVLFVTNTGGEKGETAALTAFKTMLPDLSLPISPRAQHPDS